nr:YcxB family protein [Lacrimispora saccharolytica]
MMKGRNAMKYEYRYRNTAADIWQLSMYYIYGSLVGVCNVIFTIAVFALGVSRWNSSGPFFKTFVILGCCLFPLIQPVFAYKKARKQAESISLDTHMGFDDWGIHVKQGENHWDIRWEKIRRIARKPNMILIFSDSTHGFVLADRVLKEEKNEFYNYVASKIKAAGKK